jgi:hypothetical protein
LKENKRYEGKGFSHTKVKLVVYINWTGHSVGLQVYY